VRRIQEAGQLGAIYADVRRSKALIAAVRAATVTDGSGAQVDLSELLGDDDDGIEVLEVPGEEAPAEAAAGEATEAAADEAPADGTAAAAAADEDPSDGTDEKKTPAGS
jgi:trigger factor